MRLNCTFISGAEIKAFYLLLVVVCCGDGKQGSRRRLVLTTVVNAESLPRGRVVFAPVFSDERQPRGVVFVFRVECFSGFTVCTDGVGDVTADVRYCASPYC